MGTGHVTQQARLVLDKGAYLLLFLPLLLSSLQLVLVFNLVTDILGPLTFTQAGPLMLLECAGTLPCHHTTTVSTGTNKQLEKCTQLFCSKMQASIHLLSVSYAALVCL